MVSSKTISCFVKKFRNYVVSSFFDIFLGFINEEKHIDSENIEDFI